MARGNQKRGRGGFRGASNGGHPRGRGRGGARGGRGGGGHSGGRGRGGFLELDEFDFPIQQWPSNNPPATPPPRGRGNGTPRSRGRGRGAGSMPINVFNNSHRGIGSPEETGRGRGNAVDKHSLPYGRGRNLTSRLKAGAPLSKLLNEDRPLLKPIKFVRSVHSATLFEKQEDIFLPVAETTVNGDEESHVPTTNAVFRVFRRSDNAVFSDEGEEQLEEIDFADIGKIQAQVDGTAAQASAADSQVTLIKDSTSFFVDTTPAPVTHVLSTDAIETNTLSGVLGSDTILDDDDDIIVYVAPHPRNSKPSPPSISSPDVHLSSTSILTGVEITPAAQSAPAGGHVVSSSSTELQSTPAFLLEMGTLYPELPQLTAVGSSPDAEQLPPPPSFDSISFSFDEATTTVKKQGRRLHPVGTPRSLLKRTRKPRRKSLRSFGSFGAAHEEAMLHKEDPRRAERRRGDSDINWGTSDDEDDGVDALSADMGGMELDEGLSLNAMKDFVKSMSAEGSRHMTMDDVADMERMKLEDEEQDARGPESAEEESGDDDGREPNDTQYATKDSVEEGGANDGSTDGEEEDDEDDEDDEVEEVMRAEEELLVGEAGGSEEDDSEDDDETPRRGFRTRLERLRASSGKGKGKVRAADDSSDEAMSIQMSWAEEDDAWIEQMQDILAENQHIMSSSGSRKARKYMFKAIQNGDFEEEDMYAAMMQPAKRGKDKNVPPELREQWEKDRQKKAENKQKRALERLKVAADPLAMHKGGQKSHKAMLAAARATEDLPNRIVDLVTLEQQIRRFLEDIGRRDTMTLPPADKETRKLVHELAGAFNLKSESKGKGAARYTTLVKTSKSGVGINEWKIRRILKQATNGAWGAPDGEGGRRTGKDNLAKHREGEEIGKGAAKIDGSNVGFRLLAAMGWSDGDRIGLSGGLDAPLTAIMKKTKLGLGATM